MERRKGPRIYDPFPVKVSGIDSAGKKFQAHTVVDNLSAGGLYVRLPQSFEPGAKLGIVIRLSVSQDELTPSARVAAKAVVKRIEPLPDGKYGVAVVFTQHRFV